MAPNDKVYDPKFVRVEHYLDIRGARSAGTAGGKKSGLCERVSMMGRSKMWDELVPGQWAGHPPDA